MTVRVRRMVLATVRGGSMQPTFTDGQRVLAIRRRRYRVGDAVVFEVAAEQAALGPRWRIKRVAALAGDPTPAWMGDAGPAVSAVVPPGHVVVVGDNPVSQDSRQLGFIPVDQVRGAVVGRGGREPSGIRLRGLSWDRN